MLSKAAQQISKAPQQKGGGGDPTQALRRPERWGQSPPVAVTRPFVSTAPSPSSSSMAVAKRVASGRSSQGSPDPSVQPHSASSSARGVRSCAFPTSGADISPLAGGEFLDDATTRQRTFNIDDAGGGMGHSGIRVWWGGGISLSSVTSSDAGERCVILCPVDFCPNPRFTTLWLSGDVVQPLWSSAAL